MATAKQQLAELIARQPEDSSMEQLIEELAFRAMIERGLADSTENRKISNKEMAAEIKSWQS